MKPTLQCPLCSCNLYYNYEKEIYEHKPEQIKMNKGKCYYKYEEKVKAR